MNSKPVFREQMFSFASKETSIEISLLKTFSCETEAEPTETFDSKNCFDFAQDENKQTIGPKQEQDVAPIVTPQLPEASVVEISLEPLPESRIHPFLLDMGYDDQKIPAINDSDLLFPLADEDFLGMITTQCKQAPLPEISQEKHEDEQMIYDNITKSNLFETYVYIQLHPFLPLPDSFGPIVCLLLHMEFSSIIDQTILTKACEIVNEQWNDETDGICSNTTKKEIQNLSGKIVDKLVETLGPMVDFPVLFQASAQTCNTLSTTDMLSIFFRNDPDALEAEEIESKVRDDLKPRYCESKESIDRNCISGKKRKSRTNDDTEDEKMPSHNRAKFVPSVLQLAIAWANYSTFGNDLSESDKNAECEQTSLEEFVEKTSTRLQAMGSTERRNQWNNLVERWQSRDKTS